MKSRGVTVTAGAKDLILDAARELLRTALDLAPAPALASPKMAAQAAASCAMCALVVATLEGSPVGNLELPEHLFRALGMGLGGFLGQLPRDVAQQALLFLDEGLDAAISATVTDLPLDS